MVRNTELRFTRELGKQDVFNDETHVAWLRSTYKNRSDDAVKHIIMEVNASMLCSRVCFTNGDSDIEVYDYINKTWNSYKNYSVLFCGEVIIDILNSNKYLSTKNYIKQLEKRNKNLNVDNTRSSWLDRGELIIPNLDYLKNYNYMGIENKKSIFDIFTRRY